MVRPTGPARVAILFGAVLAVATVVGRSFAQDIVFPDDSSFPTSPAAAAAGGVGAAAAPADSTTTSEPPDVRTTPIPADISTVADDSTNADSHVDAVQGLLGQASPTADTGGDDDEKVDISASALGSRSVLPRQYAAGCRAPTGQSGTCGTVRECPGIYRIRDASYLRSFLCGYQGRTPLVCCPRAWTSTNYYGQASRPATTTTRRPYYDGGTTTTTPTATTRRPAYVPTSAPVRTPRPTTATTSGTRRPSGPSQSQVQDGTRPRKPSFLPGKCGTGHGISRIVGGTEALPGSYPWMAAIYIQSGSSWMQACGGALVSNRHVVTAAHCVVAGTRSQNLPPKLFLLRLGDHNLVTTDDLPAGATVDAKVAKISRHSDFDSKTYKNDIALMELDEPVQFSQYIQPLCLPYDGVFGNLDDEIAIVTGWGYTQYDGRGSDVLKQATIRIWPEAECKEAFKREVAITSEYLCAGDGSGKKDSCQGDSGGPLVYNEGTKFYLIGVVSFGKKCATPGYPGAYTRVTKYLDWLNTHF